MNKSELLDIAKQSFKDIADWDEYAQHSEELLIEMLPYLSKEGLQKVIEENERIREQM